MKTYNQNNAQFDFKGAYIEDKKEIHLYLQRQGVVETINCAHPSFFIEISKYPTSNLYSAKVSYGIDKNVENGYSSKSGQTYKCDHALVSKEAAIKYAVKHAEKLAHKTITIDDQVLSYCYGWYSYDYQKTDKFLSSVYYDPKTYSVKDISDSKVVVAFEDGDIKTPCRQNKEYKDVIAKVLSNFHDCDYKQGNDYCVRRATWLISETFNSDYENNYMAWVSLQMEK